MVFSSIVFLFYFLPVMAALYAIAPRKLRNAALLLGSLFFYAWGEPKYVLVMVCQILPCYVLGLLVERYREKRAGQLLCALSVAVSLSFLIYFKYTDFFLENINAVTGLSLPLIRVALPIGISFYTFQMISYTADVYRGEAAQRNLLSLSLYIAMFPQLVAGPIVRYADLSGQLSERTHSWDSAAMGIRRFAAGLAKKILLANQLWALCSAFRASEEKSVLFYWLYAAASMLYIYFDFSGYSDMAIGLGAIFGFRIPENFRYPFISASITEFWRRWHMSLGSWFRDYVYIPLGGSRAGRGRQMRNILAVWMLTGFWHGAAWNFIVWGLLFAVLLVIEKLWLLEQLKRSRVLSRLYVLFFVMASFVIFQAEGMGQALADLAGLFGAGGIPLVSAEALYALRSSAVILTVSAVGATPLPKMAAERIRRGLTGTAKERSRRGFAGTAGSVIAGLAEPAAILVLFLLVTAYLAGGSFQPFLYFRF